MAVRVQEAVLRQSLVGPEKERYVNRLFSSIAPKYDLMNTVISFGKHKSWRRLAVRMSKLPESGKALDVATGTGDFALDLADAAGTNGYVVGTDFCAPMLDLARQKLAAHSNIELVTGNAESLPFDSDLFDCVTIGFGLRNVSDVPTAVAEMARVTKSGGRVVSLEILGPRSKLLQPFWRAYFFQIMPRMARIFGAEREPYDYLPDSVARFHSREELVNIFRSCGLEEVQVRNLMFGVVCIHMGTKR